MIGLAADGRLFGLDVQLLFDIGISIFNIILLVFLIGVPIILIIFAIKYFKQILYLFLDYPHKYYVFKYFEV